MTDSVDRLFLAVLAAKRADPAVSRTSRLLRAGRTKIAKKLGEEAIEVVIDAIAGNREAVVRESADLLYNLAVVWAACGIEPREVWQEMERRERMFGIAEKLQKSSSSVAKSNGKALADKDLPAKPLATKPLATKTLPKPRRKVAAARAQRAGKRG